LRHLHGSFSFVFSNPSSMKSFLHRTLQLVFFSFIALSSFTQTTNTYTSATTWTVPAAVSTLSIKVYGGAGGTGGQDCGAGCSNAAAGPTGYVLASYSVTPGDVIGIYPGAKGANGSNSVTGTGGGAGGADSYPSANYNGGTGGNTGSSGSSGGGGGGGAASIITINSVVKIVAGGAGGGGGMANLANSGLPGSSSVSSNGINAGGNGTTPGGDGGGGGGGGGGQFASAGGTTYPAGGESAGNGGFLGSNSVSGAASVNTNGNIAWTNTGQIEITFVSTLPVTWLSFTATKQHKSVLLSWSTAAEINALNYEVQRSADGINWTSIGLVTAAGNTTVTQRYSFTDLMPLSAINHYRLVQRDIDDKKIYSKVLFCSFSDADNRLKIYPNPVVNGSAAVYLTQASSVTIYSSTGIALMKQELPAGSSMLDLSALTPGTYYIRTKNDKVSFIVQ
jgi:hypothetical protein